MKVFNEYKESDGRPEKERPFYLHNIISVLLFLILLEGSSGTWSRNYRHVVLRPTPPRPTLPPDFDPAVPTNVTIVASKTALLSCVVHNLNNNSVSWIRHRDLHILSVGSITYTNDDRFEAIPEKESANWALRLRYARPRDSGQYDCQISSTPPRARTVHLNVIEPQARILRGPDIHIGVGSLINLTCTVSYSPEAPEYLHWYHKDRIMREEGSRVAVRTYLGHYSVSQLIVRDAQPSDSGIYTCNPAHSREHSITVHVHTGEYPAAMQGSSSVTLSCKWKFCRMFSSQILSIFVLSHLPYFYM